MQAGESIMQKEQIGVIGMALAICFVLLLFAISGCLGQSQEAKENSPQSPPALSDKSISTADSRNGVEKTQATISSIVPDGVYQKNITYAYHSGNTAVAFKIEVKDDVILSASAKAINADNVSEMIIGKFDKALPQLVVGKKINELNIPKNVAGSSLTTAAFKDYIKELTTTGSQ